MKSSRRLFKSSCLVTLFAFEYAADHGDELCKLAHTLVERVRGLEGGRQRRVVVAENIVIEIVTAEVDNLLSHGTV